jgi:two-component system, OmpR family, osmolarity sensor histidine kinase EnvZ
MGNLWPKSLFVRNWLVLLVFAVAVQVLTMLAYMVMQRPSMERLAGIVAGQVNSISIAMAGVPPGERNQALRTINRDVRLITATEAEVPAELPFRGLLLNTFLKSLRTKVPAGSQVRWSGSPSFQLWTETHIGGASYWLVFPMSQLLPSGGLRPTLEVGFGIALMALAVASLIQRRIHRPLKQIAEAARKLGKGGRPEPLPRYSSSEMAALASQFNAMTENLDAMESSRAVMLAGISHDIRTPLTKLRLALELGQESERKSVAHYIDQIDAIVGQFLDYGRIGTDEPSMAGDLNTLICQIAGEFEERGQHFCMNLKSMPQMRFRPIAMLRTIRNLMDNAVKYGVEGFEVATFQEGSTVNIAIRDRGPGVRSGDTERLLQPFIRADEGRSIVGGTGLGLAIADRLVRLHGGKLSLVPRQGGGLEALIQMPLMDSSSVSAQVHSDIPADAAVTS